MFLFYHTDQTTKNASYYKGVLFENLLKQFLNSRGYEVTVRNVKSGAEYDINGIDKTTGVKIIGEAKAHEDKIDIFTFKAFVGSLYPFELDINSGNIKGLFLSTSHLTPEAKDFYQSIKEKKNSVVAITGTELWNDIIEELKLIIPTKLQNKLKELKYIIRTNYLLICNTGNYIVVLCSSPESVNPSYFILINQNGDEIIDEDFISAIKQNVKELKDLFYIKLNNNNDFKFEKKIEKGLLVGNSWIDYRLPAAPQYFIGRENLCKEIYGLIENESQQNIIQIKSRSGEGKSSLLAFLDMRFSNNDFHTELHDARNIKSILNIFVIVQRFTKSSYLSNNFEDVEKQLETLFNNKEIKSAVLMIDQFESTFTNTDVFHAYEYLINIIFNFRSKLFVILTRKSDQLTTYDEKEISLSKINSLSVSLELTDFEPIEAKVLIDKINEESNNKISKELKSHILEFSNCFPWLLKRTMAHTIKLINHGQTQNELIESSLNLEELFKEELRELQEEEKGYLKRIAAYLPTTINELQQKFNEDKRLLKILEILTSHKLLRLTGDTYDTYNDVFKEYLITGKIPGYNPPIIYRSSPYTVLRLFHDLITITKPVYPLEDIQELLGTTKGYAFSLMKELSNLNLLRSLEKYWEIPDSIKRYYSEKKLGEFIRNQLTENTLVIKLINQVETNNKLTTQMIPSFLSSLFPFNEASEKTWTTYSNNLITWLDLTKIITFGQHGKLKIVSESRDKIFNDLENLTDIKYKPEYFLPTTSFKNIEKCFLVLSKDISKLESVDSKALYDLKRGGWLINNSLVVNDFKEFKNLAIEQITTENHKKIWTAAKNGDHLFKVFKDIFGESYTYSSSRSFLEKLINWGKALELIPNKKYKYSDLEYYSLSQKTGAWNSNFSKTKNDLQNSRSEISFKKHFNELESFIHKHKHSSIPRNGATRTLSCWATMIRMKRQRKILSEEKIDLLNQIGFDWNPIQNTWDERYRALLKFKEEYGHTQVPKDHDSKLFFWVKNQRMNIYRNSISPERKALLLKTGILEVNTSIQLALIPIKTLNLLKRYYLMHGHINVPQLDRENKYLGRYINTQRIQKKLGKISKERIAILEEMGIVWDAKEFNWMKKLAELEKFFKKNGHFNVTRRNSENLSLGKWVYDLKRKRPSPEKLKMLLKIGFNWEIERLNKSKHNPSN
jgi:hypothetical protein